MILPYYWQHRTLDTSLKIASVEKTKSSKILDPTYISDASSSCASFIQDQNCASTGDQELVRYFYIALLATTAWQQNFIFFKILWNVFWSLRIARSLKNTFVLARQDKTSFEGVQTSHRWLDMQMYRAGTVPMSLWAESSLEYWDYWNWTFTSMISLSKRLNNLALGLSELQKVPGLL